MNFKKTTTSRYEFSNDLMADVELDEITIMEKGTGTSGVIFSGSFREAHELVTMLDQIFLDIKNK